jgi:hypothetical protein
MYPTDDILGVKKAKCCVVVTVDKPNSMKPSKLPASSVLHVTPEPTYEQEL